MQWIAYVLVPIVALLVGYFTYKSDVKKAVPQPWLTALLRGLLAASVLLLLVAPFIKWKQNKTVLPYVLLLQDNSQSIAANLGADTANFRKKFEALKKELQQDFQVIPLAFSSDVSRDSLFTYSGSSTNIAQALAALPAFANPNIPSAVVLATDGHFNIGENPLYQNLPLRASFYGVSLGDTTMQRDIKIGQVYANEVVSANSQFQVTADVLGSNLKGYNGALTISLDGQVIAKDNVSISDERFDRSYSFTIPSGKPGWKRFTVAVSRAEQEDNVQNNQRDFFVQVIEQQKKVLLAALAPHPDVKAIKSAIESLDQFKLTTHLGSIPDISNYDVVILHQLPAKGATINVLQKPTWFILGSQSSVQAIGNTTKLFTHASGGLTDASPQVNSGFNLFNLKAGAAGVLDKLPPLATPAQYTTAADAISVIQSKQSGSGIWLLKSGANAMAITMGEGLWRWRMYDYKNNGNFQTVDDLIKQTLSFLSAQNNGNRLSVELNKFTWNEQESIAMSAYFTNANNELTNTPEVNLQLKDSSGKVQNFSMEKVGNAYQSNLGLWQRGTYQYTASCTYQGKTYSATGSFMVDGQPLELMNKGADFALIAQLAAKYKGSTLTLNNMSSLADSIKNNSYLKPVIEEREQHAPLIDWRWFFLVILLLATAEWLLRKYWMAH